MYCAFWFLIAFLEFFQDYFSSVLNNSHFSLLESLSYKVFWLFFIPLSLVLINAINEIKYTKKVKYLIVCGQIILISFFHLIIFSLFLFGVSKLIHGENFWRLSWLLTEKFSNRLYITFFFYIVIPSVYFWLKRKKETINPKRSYSKTITVKNGRKSIFVEVDRIEWISSDGPYILLHTSTKRHIIHDSLKNIIGSLPDNFKRIHHSTIVNINMIKELKSRMNGDYDVIMNDNEVLRLSRNYTKELKGTLL